MSFSRKKGAFLTLPSLACVLKSAPGLRAPATYRAYYVYTDGDHINILHDYINLLHVFICDGVEIGKKIVKSMKVRALVMIQYTCVDFFLLDVIKDTSESVSA